MVDVWESQKMLEVRRIEKRKEKRNMAVLRSILYGRVSVSV